MEGEVVLVQKQIDCLNVCWIDLAHKEGMPNYIHMLVSGHITFYLRKWKNLYRYQKQGWEHLHLQFTYAFHHRTHHGGHSWLNPVMRSHVVCHASVTHVKPNDVSVELTPAVN
jgi:hypothetical protein